MQIKKPYLNFIENLDLSIHRDPFDRMIIATAKVQEMTIVTIDENIQQYDINWVW